MESVCEILVFEIEANDKVEISKKKIKLLGILFLQ